MNISPKGDLLAFSAALCWAFYSQFMSQMTSRYGTFFATRKVFFYGLLTIIPILLFSDNTNLCCVPFSSVKVWGNLLFLSVIASQLCFIVWNRVMSEIGNVTSTNYVYWLLMEGKDVILYLYDYDAYVRERDFFYPFDENVTGCRVDSFESLCSVIESGDYAIDKEERKRLLERFWGETAQYDSSGMILDFVKGLDKKR